MIQKIENSRERKIFIRQLKVLLEAGVEPKKAEKPYISSSPLFYADLVIGVERAASAIIRAMLQIPDRVQAIWSQLKEPFSGVNAYWAAARLALGLVFALFPFRMLKCLTLYLSHISSSLSA
ncbi:hypothetical protein ACFLQ0_05775 [Nitrospinota bacterium]